MKTIFIKICVSVLLLFPIVILAEDRLPEPMASSGVTVEQGGNKTYGGFTGNEAVLNYTQSPAESISTVGAPSFNFDGSADSYVSINNSYTSSEIGSSGMTACFWAKPEATGDYERFLEFSNGASADNIIISRFGTTSKMHVGVFRGSSKNDILGNRKEYVSPDQFIENSVWHHYCVVIAASAFETTTVNIYKDSDISSNGSGSVLTPQSLNRSVNYLGKSSFTSSNNPNYIGYLDEVRVYNTAVPQNEIENIKKGVYSNNMITYYSFSENEVSLIKDISSGNHDGVYHGNTSSAVNFSKTDQENGILPVGDDSGIGGFNTMEYWVNPKTPNGVPMQFDTSGMYSHYLVYNGFPQNFEGQVYVDGVPEQLSPINLVANPGFENIDGTTDFASNWVKFVGCDSTSPERCKAEIADSNSPAEAGGGKALNIASNVNGGWNTNKYVMVRQSLSGLQENKLYKLSAWVKNASLQDGLESHVWFCGSGYWSNNSTGFTMKISGNKDVWVKRSGYLYIPSGFSGWDGAYGNLRVSAIVQHLNQNIWFDGFSVNEVLTNSPTGNPISPNSWHHVAVVANDSLNTSQLHLGNQLYPDASAPNASWSQPFVGNVSAFGYYPEKFSAADINNHAQNRLLPTSSSGTVFNIDGSDLPFYSNNGIEASAIESTVLGLSAPAWSATAGPPTQNSDQEELFGFEQNTLVGCLNGIVFRLSNSYCHVLNQKSSIKIMNSRTSINGVGVTEVATLLYPSKTIVGDVYGDFDFNYWGRNLNQNNASGTPDNGDASWRVAGEINPNAQAKIDGEQFKSYLSKINSLAGEAKKVSNAEFNGTWNLDTTDDHPQDPYIGGVDQKSFYPEGRVWLIDCSPTGNDLTYCGGDGQVEFNGDHTYNGSGTVIVKGANLRFGPGADITRNNNARLGFIVLDGNVTFAGNNKIEAAILCYKAGDPLGKIDIQGNGEFIGSFVGEDFGMTGTNIRFYYDYDLDSAWPPGFKYFKMPTVEKK